MSMILDALSRAEQERRSENGTVLDPARYVGNSSIKEDRIKKWILLALLVNLVLGGFLLAGFLLKDDSQNFTQNVNKDISVEQQEVASKSNQKVEQTLGAVEPVHSSLDQDVVAEPALLEKPAHSNLVPLSQEPALSLREEAQVSKVRKPKLASKPRVSGIAKKTPPVRYSTQPLSEPSRKVELPEPVATRPARTDSGDVREFTDLSPSERSRLSQYEINVHVYDSNVKNRFVLINMTKYKEGDRLPGGGPLVAAITPEGVVMDTGNGRALLERK